MKLQLLLIILSIACATWPLLAAPRSRDEAAAPNFGRNRVVRVATVTQNRLQRGADIVEDTMAWLDQAAASHPDIVCLPEVWTRKGPEPVPGPTTRMMAEWARAHHCYVICPIKTKVKGKVYNSAVLIDRAGQIVGRFDKIHPTEGELKGGVCPGAVDPPVFQCDFGKIGIQICFDVNWRDRWERLVNKGAEIIFWPSAYPADRQLSALAWMNQVYVVSSTMTQFAAIYDICGDTLAKTAQYQQWTSAAISLDKRLFEIDYHISKMRKIQAKYGQGKRVNVHWIASSDWLTLESLDPELSVDDIIKEFELTPWDAYHERCTQAVNAAREANK